MPEKQSARRISVILLLPLLLTSLVTVPGIGALDNQIRVSLAPPKLIADGATHDSVYVQLVNSKGEPIQASSDVSITLTSSHLEVGTVEDTVTIFAGSSFGSAKFTATATPGATLITATAPGFITGGAEMTTTSAAREPKLRVYPLPSIIPAKQGTVGKVVVEILNENDVPYVLPDYLEVDLSTSNSSILTVPGAATIPAGAYYTVADYTVGTKPGNATIAAIAQGFNSAEAVVSVQKPGKVVSALHLELGPSILMPGGSLDTAAVVTLLDKNNQPVWMKGSMYVSLSSSADKTVAGVQTTTLITNGTFGTYISLSSLGRGQAKISATAQGALMDTKLLTVDGFQPSSLEVYTTPNDILTGNALKPMATILVTDQNGDPVPVNGDVNVFLASSNTDVGMVAQFVTIPAGAYYAHVEIEPQISVGSIDISASARGLTPASNTLKTTVLAMNVTLATSRPAQINDTVIATLSVDRFGEAVQGASVTWSVIGGRVVTQSATTGGNGGASATITQNSQTMRVSVQVLKPGYKVVSVSKLSTIPAQQSTELTVNILGLVVPLFNVIVTIGVVVIAVFAVYIFLKYRRRGSEKLEVVG